jgi:hypothetical protein
MDTSSTRPEDRQRSGREQGVEWADTQPLFHRSEAFAEDLHGAADGAPAADSPDSAWHRTAAMPLLGLALSTVLGLFGR